MDTPISHYNDLNITEATSLQNVLRKKLDLRPMSQPVRTIGGADISLNLNSDIVYAGIVILDYESLQPIGYSLIKSTNTFPYVPGYLAFREIPAIVKAFEQIPVRQRPDLIMFDGNGILHSRRMGIASHFGVLTQTATLGCAKKKLAGKYEEPENLKGAYSPVIDKNEVIGFALQTKLNVKPVFISPGNFMNLEDSRAVTLHCINKHRLPEPTRKAHEFVNLFRTDALKEGYFEIPKMTLF
ncbi:endonuclease V [Dyadobacter sp. CY312]|uniref:endonuclease V n=1 Tax=Dyadobacter sp. CY312 TaxID=2907303 RepID=UPI001F458C86|nr:endonuclease V [Dyadobacter sp. CY312]MCE7041701.1 endonuclease V [Dyadobacter sp. CY312]